MSNSVQSPMTELHEFHKPYHNKTENFESTKTEAETICGECIGHENEIFFDTIGVQFNFGIFLTQLIGHLFFPRLLNKHGQFDTSFSSIFMTFITPLLAYIMIISYFMIPDSNKNHVIQGAYILPLVYFLQHRIVIAIKYGSLSRTEYKKFMECSDSILCNSYLHQMMLFTGWRSMNPFVVRFELAAASAKLGARIDEIDIIIENPDNSSNSQSSSSSTGSSRTSGSNTALNQLRAWNAFLRGHDIIDYTSTLCKQLRYNPKDGNYLLSIYDYCESLLLHSTKTTHNMGSYDFYTDIYGFIHTSIPFILLTIHPNTFNNNINTTNNTTSTAFLNILWISIFFISSTILNIIYTRVFFVLLNIAVIDVLRQKSIFINLNNMIRITDIMLDYEFNSSINNQQIGQKDLDNSEFRVAEILSIQPSIIKYKKNKERMNETVHNDNNSSSTCLNDNSSNSNNTRTSVLGERIYKDNEAHMLPRISFDESHNIVAWTHARLVMQNFGERFHFRLELYVIAAIAMLVVMMVIGLLNLGMAEDRMKLFLTPWFLQTLLSVTMCIVFLLLITLSGACVNDTLETHSQTMCSHALRLNRKVEKLGKELEYEKCEHNRTLLEERIDKLNDTITKLDAMRAVIDTNTDLKPFKVFGFNAQSSLTMSILTTAVSFYGILLSLLSNTEDQAIAAAA